MRYLVDFILGYFGFIIYVLCMFLVVGIIFGIGCILFHLFMMIPTNVRQILVILSIPVPFGIHAMLKD